MVGDPLGRCVAWRGDITFTALRALAVLAPAYFLMDAALFPGIEHCKEPGNVATDQYRRGHGIHGISL